MESCVNSHLEEGQVVTRFLLMNLRQDHFACYDLGMASERFPDCTFGFNAESAMESLTECPSPASSQSNSVGLLSREKSDVRGN